MNDATIGSLVSFEFSYNNKTVKGTGQVVRRYYSYNYRLGVSHVRFEVLVSDSNSKLFRAGERCDVGCAGVKAA